MYKLHLLQHPDWHRTGTSYCYCYIFFIHHYLSIIFSKTYPSFLTVKEGIFRIPPSPFSQREGFLKSSRPSLPLKKAPPLISVFSPQGRRGKPPSGAQNRYALRLADHQRSTPCCAGWDRLNHYHSFCFY